MPNVLIACTGSVASIKLKPLVEAFQKHNVQVKVIVTQSAKHFIDDVEVLTDEDEWKTWNKMGDQVLHIELRRWAHVVIVAPLSANTLAKVVNGLCDNLVTCVLRAWDWDKPRWVAPAMNTHMYTHPLTAKHLEAIEELGFGVIGPVSKMLACGDLGMGGMASVEEIVSTVMQNLPS
jgi:phosphopantothenoylcysteine decarboxylase